MMHIQLSELNSLLSSTELCDCCQINPPLLLELVEHNIVVPQSGKLLEEWQFSVKSVLQIKKAARIQRDLAIDWNAIALVLDLIEQRDTLQSEVSRLTQQLARFHLTD